MGALPLLNEAGQTTGLMGDRAARVGGYGFPVPGAKALGALREAVGPPTKAGAAPPRRGLPDEGGSGPGPPLVRREPPLVGRWRGEFIALPPE